MQTIAWDSEKVGNNNTFTKTLATLAVDLDRTMFSTSESVLVFNEQFEYVYEITNIDTRQENVQDGETTYSIDINNISLPEYYSDQNGNIVKMRYSDVLFLKYNASIEKSIGLTVDEMVLQKNNYMTNYKQGEQGESDNVPIAEISLLGVNVNEDNFAYGDVDDLFYNR